jgi:hypothetical protein
LLRAAALVFAIGAAAFLVVREQSKANPPEPAPPAELSEPAPGPDVAAEPELAPVPHADEAAPPAQEDPPFLFSSKSLSLDVLETLEELGPADLEEATPPEDTRYLQGTKSGLILDDLPRKDDTEQ